MEDQTPQNLVQRFLQHKHILIVGIVVFVLLILTILFVSAYMSSTQSNPDDLLKPVDASKKDVLIRDDMPPYEPNVLIIRYKEGYSYEILLKEKKEKQLKEIGEILAKAGVIDQQPRYQNVEGALRDYYLLTFKSGTDLKKAQQILHESPYIDFAQPSYELQTFATPNDPLYPHSRIQIGYYLLFWTIENNEIVWKDSHTKRRYFHVEIEKRRQ